MKTTDDARALIGLRPDQDLGNLNMSPREAQVLAALRAAGLEVRQQFLTDADGTRWLAVRAIVGRGDRR